MSHWHTDVTQSHCHTVTLSHCCHTVTLPHRGKRQHVRWDIDTLLPQPCHTTHCLIVHLSAVALHCHTKSVFHCQIVIFFLCYCLTTVLSHCHIGFFTLSHCHIVQLSHSHTVILPFCTTATPSFCLNFTLSICHTLELSYCPTVRLSNWTARPTIHRAYSLPYTWTRTVWSSYISLVHVRLVATLLIMSEFVGDIPLIRYQIFLLSVATLPNMLMFNRPGIARVVPQTPSW